jgi:hypothetical protein
MDYSQALQKLRQHASASEGESFTLALYHAERQAPIPELRGLFDDILSCFEVINHAINTQHPSEAITGKADSLPRSLVANVSEILSVSWSHYLHWTSSDKFTATFRTELVLMVVQIGIAWDAILAGDIDDIREQVQAEFSARNYVD